MRKSLLQIQPSANYFTKYRLNSGFSMLEAVVVVGVLLALAVAGFFSYGQITDNAKKAAVKSAASEVHTAAVMARAAGDSVTGPQDVISHWNASTDKIKVDIVGTSSNGDFCVQATDAGKPLITDQSGSCTP